MLLQGQGRADPDCGHHPSVPEEGEEGGCMQCGWLGPDQYQDKNPALPDPAGGGTDDHGQVNVSVSALPPLYPIQDAVRGGFPGEEGTIPAKRGTGARSAPDNVLLEQETNRAGQNGESQDPW
ncbi:unnamed protein product [Eretmochelys imbricata]